MQLNALQSVERPIVTIAHENRTVKFVFCERVGGTHYTGIDVYWIVVHARLTDCIRNFHGVIGRFCFVVSVGMQQNSESFQIFKYECNENMCGAFQIYDDENE